VLQHKVPISQAVVDLTSKIQLKAGCLIFCPAGHKLDEILSILETGFNLYTFRKFSRLARDYNLDYLLIDSHPGIEKDTLLSMALCDYLVLISRLTSRTFSVAAS